MRLRDALNAIIDDGMTAARLNYTRPDQRLKLEGALHGFEECRDKQPAEIAALLVQASARTQQAYHDRAADYWYWRCRELEIGWVANVVSVILLNEGAPVIVPPTARGLLKAMEIVGGRDVHS